MPDPVEDRVWALVQDQMPPCGTCGHRLKPGGVPGLHVLVCTTCSTVDAVTTEWVDQQVAAAWEQIEAEAP